MTLLFGGGGHGAVVLDALIEDQIPVRAVIDDNVDVVGSLLLGLVPVCSLETVDKSTCTGAFVAVGANEVRHAIVSRTSSLGLPAIIVCHPQSVVSAHAQIGQGTFVGARAVVEARAEIGRFCIINTASVVTHDCKIGEFSHIAPGAVLCGRVKVGRFCLVGANCSILPGLTIGDNVTVGAGCIVTKNVPSNSVIRCEPGRVI